MQQQRAICNMQLNTQRCKMQHVTRDTLSQECELLEIKVQHTNILLLPPNPKYNMQDAKRSMQPAACSNQNINRNMRHAKCEMQTAKYGLYYTDCDLRNTMLHVNSGWT